MEMFKKYLKTITITLQFVILQINDLDKHKK